MKCIKLKLEEEQTLSNDTVLNSLCNLSKNGNYMMACNTFNSEPKYVSRQWTKYN